MEKLSEQTVGIFYESSTTDDLKNHYSKLYNQILNIYLVAGKSTFDGDGLEHNFIVTVNYENQRAFTTKKEIISAGVSGYQVVIKENDYTSIYINRCSCSCNSCWYLLLFEK